MPEIEDNEIVIDSFPITFVSGEYLNIFRGFVENNIIIDVDDTSFVDEYRIEYRFAEFTTQDDQNATNLFPDSELEYYPDENNKVRIDIGLFAEIFIPAFPISQGLYASQYGTFQVQYRQKYLDSGVEVISDWVTAYDPDLVEFVPFISIHAGGNISQYLDTYQIFNSSKTLYKNYQNDILLISSEENKSADIELTLKYYTRAKGLYQPETLNINAFNGVYVIRPLQSLIDNENVRYLAVYESSTLLSSHTINNTTEDANEFVLRWLGTGGDVKSWIFTKKIDIETQINTNFTEREFRQIPKSIEEMFILETEGLSKTEFDFIKDLNMSNLISITNQEETYACIVNNPAWSEDTYNNTYDFTIDIVKKEQYLMKV